MRRFFRHLLVLSMVLSLGACASEFNPPEVAENICRKPPCSYAELNSQFDKKIKKRFKKGSSAEKMVDALRAEGFTVGIAMGDYHGQANYTSRNVMCRHKWSVLWKSNRRGKLTLVEGRYDGWCL